MSVWSPSSVDSTEPSIQVLSKINPLSERLIQVDVKIQIVEVPQQVCMTKDNVTLHGCAIQAYWRVKAADILSSAPAMQIRYLEAMQAMAKSANSKVIFLPGASNVGSSMAMAIAYGEGPEQHSASSSQKYDSGNNDFGVSIPASNVR
ncbi:hypothetical protein LZ554_009424 [Drepanopeziza brunnea f. sp. 'monogermtubi']|nr:hypothetical protein LZ554_009424 [Drepanopeziza brunnea f. sp. 'monogermtubi']